ncbi:hypothetical protein L8W62_04915 [Campylobacter lari]|nr:hypothetical protein [Campylobacter lari]
MVSLSLENIKNYPGFYVSDLLPLQFCKTTRIFDFKNIIQKYAEFFSKENIIIRLFDKNE